MIRMRRPVLAAVTAAVGALSAPAAGWAAACPTVGPVVAHQHARGVVKLTWSPAAELRSTKPRYRVLRGKGVVGQTRKASMVVRGTPGTTITVRVGVVGSGGRAPRCYSARRVRVAALPTPGRPQGLSIQRLGDREVKLSWLRVRGAKAYRAMRDGAVLGQTTRTSMTAAVTPGKRHTFMVTAVGARARQGKPSTRLRFDAAVRAPGRPDGLVAAVITSNGARLTWSPAAAGTYPVRGYRLFRGDDIVGQFNGTQADVTRLVHAREYQFSLAAVDTRGTLGPSAELVVRTELATPTTGHLHAFVLASTDSSFKALQRNYQGVGTAYPTYFDCNSANLAAIRGKDDPLITQWMKDRRILVMPRFNCQQPRTLRAIFTQPDVRSSLIDQLVATVVRYDYDGLNLDFEAGAPQDRDSLSAFVADLARALHRAGRRLSVDASPKYREDLTHPRSAFYDYKVLAEHADWIFVMSWGLHWTTSAPGPIADIRWLRRVYEYVAAQPNKAKFIMGLPLYGFDWAGGGGPGNPATPLGWDTIQQLIDRTGAQPRYDADSDEWTFTYTDEAGAGHEVWFVDAASINGRFALARELGLGGIGAWRLGQEDPSLWSQPTVVG
jgi:spore germination protein YaaH